MVDWGCERDQNSVAEAKSLRVGTCARQRLNKDLELTESEGVLSATKTLEDSFDGIPGKKRGNVWAVSKTISALQTGTNHILHFMSIYYGDEVLFKTRRIILRLRWRQTLGPA